MKVIKLSRKWAKILVPKIGEIRFRLSRPLPGTFGMTKITLDRSSRSNISFISIPVEKDRIKAGNIVGIDREVTSTSATSDGKMFNAPTSPKLVVKQRPFEATLSRQVKGSKRRAKTKTKLARVHAGITDRRKD